MEAKVLRSELCFNLRTHKNYSGIVPPENEMKDDYALTFCGYRIISFYVVNPLQSFHIQHKYRISNRQNTCACPQYAVLIVDTGGQPKRGGPPIPGLGERLTTPRHKRSNLLRNVTRGFV
jgi:hypothetical protein